MTALIDLHDRFFGRIESWAPALLPTLARLVFAGVLLGYFWAAALTKIEGGPFAFSLGAYAQIFPRAMEAAGYDVGQLGLFHTIVVAAGTWAEFILPALVVLGLFTRLAALGMVVFVLVQSWVDIVGHGVGAETAGAWFDRASDSAIADQRALWLFVLVFLVMRGAGPLSLDRVLARNGPWARPASPRPAPEARPAP